MSMAHTAGRALVTGASAGTGAANANRLARRSHGLIPTAPRQAQLDRVAGDTSCKVSVVSANLADLAWVQRTLRDDTAAAENLPNKIVMSIDDVVKAALARRRGGRGSLQDGLVSLVARPVTSSASLALRRGPAGAGGRLRRSHLGIGHVSRE